ncbi:PREDICTED: serine/threonine/tyrosine-interacting-like protein 1 isoform X2 [Condylura cristata]|uniref:serine/threonine/tyrosine-interacting-like protein 1 isoform X2 n=1 Tax=Condylura cristata TaxID=143302 RepID=UPI000643D590|nr:PREDICTED: serine/threonine/tyrosine-interacting-like protein 1 isoform X2 [Condylura cristata]
MAGLVLCEPTELYNILNQVTKLSRLTEPNYLCLLDVRSKWEYDESHVITALRVKKKANGYLFPESLDLECVKYCVVYDNNTTSLEVILKQDDEDVDEDSDDNEQGVMLGTALECATALTHNTRYPIYILKGGYQQFSAMYHFFRTQKIIWMPQELDAFQPYPVEIIPGKIYLGDFRQACDPKIQKDLKIKAHVNVCMETTPLGLGPMSRSAKTTCAQVGTWWLSCHSGSRLSSETSPLTSLTHSTDLLCCPAVGLEEPPLETSCGWWTSYVTSLPSLHLFPRRTTGCTA